MKKFWVVIISVIVSGVIAGGGTYYYLDQKTTREKNDLKRRIDDANGRIVDLNNQISALDQTSSTDTNDSPALNASLNKDIESVDFSKIVTIDTRLGDTLDRPLYADLNNDNSEEALVVSTNGGTGGYKNVYIFGMRNGSPLELYKKMGLGSGNAQIVNNIVHLDYVNFDSEANRNAIEVDLVVDTHTKLTWNGTTFVESAR